MQIKKKALKEIPIGVSAVNILKVFLVLVLLGVSSHFWKREGDINEIISSVILISVFVIISVISAIEINQILSDETKIKAYIMWMAISVILSIGAILIVKYKFSEESPLAWGIVGFVIGEFLGKIAVEFFMGSEIEIATSSSDAGRSKFIVILNRNRYQLTSIIGLLGINMLIGTQFSDYSWYMRSIIPLLMIMPLVFVVIRDIKQLKKTKKEKIKLFMFLKTYKISNLSIELLVSFVIFIIEMLVFVIFKAIPESWKAVGDQIWITLAIVSSVGILVILHALFDKDTLGGKLQKLLKKKKDGGFYDLDLREQMLLLEIVLISVFLYLGNILGNTIFYIGNEGISVARILILLISMGGMFVVLSMIQYYYSEYVRMVKNVDIYSISRVHYIIGIVYLIVIIVIVSSYRFNSEIDVVGALYGVSAIVGLIMIFQNFSAPKPEIISSRASDGASSKRSSYVLYLIPSIPLFLGVIGYVFLRDNKLSEILSIVLIILALVGFMLIYRMTSHKSNGNRTNTKGSSPSMSMSSNQVSIRNMDGVPLDGLYFDASGLVKRKEKKNRIEYIFSDQSDKKKKK